MDYTRWISQPWHFQSWQTSRLDNAFSVASFDTEAPSWIIPSYKQLINLSIPLAFVLLVAPVRILQLRRANLKVLPNYVGAIKATLAIAVAATELTILVLGLRSSPKPDDVASAIQLCRILASCVFGVVSFFEHGRSVTPSSILMVYLAASTTCQSLQLQQQHSNVVLLGTLCWSVGLQILLLIVESRSKYGYLRQPYSELPLEQTSSRIGRAFMLWMNNLIWLGNCKTLTQADLPPLDDDLESKHLRGRMEDMWHQTTKTAPPSATDGGMTLLWVVVRFFRRALLFNFLPRLTMIMFRYMQPIFIHNTIQYVTDPATESENQQTAGYYLILTAVLIYVGMGTSFCVYYQNHNRIKIQSRGALVGLIHAKSLTVSEGVYDDASVVMHMSSDTETMENFAWLCQEMCGQIVEVIIGMSMLSAQLGWWCLVPVAIIAISSQIVKWTGRLTSAAMVEWQRAKQDRIGITTSMIDYIKGIKMMGMTKYITDTVQGSRVTDLVTGLDYRWIVVYFNLTVNGIAILTPVATLLAYAINAHLRGQESLDATTAFTLVATITLVTVPANVILALVPQFATAYTCAARIQGYLLQPSRDDKRVLAESSQSLDSVRTPAIIFTDVTLRPAPRAQVGLQQMNFSLGRGLLSIICGPTGAGKTTLIRAMLGEIVPDSGTIAVSTKRIGYCSQKPWLTNVGIKEAICGDMENLDQAWYETVLHACGLDQDVKEMSIGDAGVVGSRGATLSGGQRQRVALARAVYARPEILVLDDVLSALDSKTEAHVAKMLLGPDAIFRQQGMTVVLITHAIQYLPLADQILVLGNAEIEEQGCWEDLRTSSGYISKLQLAAPNAASDTDSTASSKVTYGSLAKTVAESSAADDGQDTTGSDISVYSYYFRCVSITAILIFFLCIATDGAALAITPSVLRAWSEAGGAHIWFYTTWYALSSLLSLAATGSVIWSALILIAPKAGEVLHLRLLRTITSAPLSYFTVTDSGSILNRFTEDMTYVDHTLPFHMMNAFWNLSRLVSQLILLSITQISVAISTPFLALALFLLQKVFLRTSRQIRFMDIELRAKVLSSFLETLEGVSVIRAFGWQSQYVGQNIQQLDISQRPHYMMLSIQQWLSLVLDMLVAALSVITVGLAVWFRASTTGGQTGIALNIILTISTTLTRLLQSWTQLETSLGAVSRIKSLEATLEPEHREYERIEPPVHWPATGTVEFQDVVASYNPTAVALNGISLTVHAGQKVGICGRTGSGKSTLLLSLLRLIELNSGAILVDGIDLSSMPRESLRTRLIAVPQDAFVLNETIRYNIDPSGIASDKEIVAALEKVLLWQIIQSRLEKDNASPASNAPLDSSLKDLPLSHGQLQLFGLARALLLKNRSKILLLDEATSNVDAETESIMQRIIKEEFAGHTIIAVAHKLNTIRDADTIVVMDKGKIVEIGSPDELLAKDTTTNNDLKGDGEQTASKAWFKEMWNNAGLE